MRIISRTALIFAFLPIIGNAGDIDNLNSPFSVESLNQIESSITENRTRLSQIASKTPNRKLSAVVFFQRDMQAAEAIETIKNPAVTIKGFRHGTPDNSGGYIISENETIEEALKSYRRDHVLFLNRDAEFTRTVIEDVRTDEQVREAMAARLREIHSRQSDYINRGLRIIGLEVSGQSTELVQVWDSNPSIIRSLEVREGRPIPNKFNTK